MANRDNWYNHCSRKAPSPIDSIHLLVGGIPPGILQHVQLLTCQVPSFANQHCQSETWMTPWCLAHMTIRVCRGPFEHLMVRLYAHPLCMENICWALRSLHLLCCLIGGAVETPFGWELNLLPVCTRYTGSGASVAPAAALLHPQGT